ncbi:hypothetical protein BDM02DRAFT_3115947, partial [Thelephora ganbajun]
TIARSTRSSPILRYTIDRRGGAVQEHLSPKDLESDMIGQKSGRLQVPYIFHIPPIARTCRRQ